MKNANGIVKDNIQGITANPLLRYSIPACAGFCYGKNCDLLLAGFPAALSLPFAIMAHRCGLYLMLGRVMQLAKKQSVLIRHIELISTMAGEHTLLKRKILFRAAHRGIKEMDIILGGYSQARIEQMSDQQLEALSIIVTFNDQPLFKMLSLSGEEQVTRAIAEYGIDSYGTLASHISAILVDIWRWMRLDPEQRQQSTPVSCPVS